MMSVTLKEMNIYLYVSTTHFFIHKIRFVGFYKCTYVYIAPTYSIDLPSWDRNSVPIIVSKQQILVNIIHWFP